MLRGSDPKRLCCRLKRKNTSCVNFRAVHFGAFISTLLPQRHSVCVSLWEEECLKTTAAAGISTALWRVCMHPALLINMY